MKIFSILIGSFVAFMLACLSVASLPLMIVFMSLMFGLLLIGLLAPHLQAKALLWVLVIFPLLPYHAGFDPLPGLLPAFRSQRILTMVMLSLWMLKSKNIKDSIIKFPFSRYFMLIVIGMAVASVIPTPNISKLFQTGVHFQEFFLIGVMILDGVRTEHDVRRVMKFIAVPAVIVAVIGIFEYFTKGKV